MPESYRPRTERHEHPADMLKHKLREQARAINHSVAESYGVDDLLAADGTVDPQGYAELLGEAAVQQDVESATRRELEFSNALHPDTQGFYRRKYGAESVADLLRIWKENKSREKNSQMEMAVTLLLSKMLGQGFLVLRTAAIDDYDHGVDNIILDFHTGEVVGAFDEVHQSDNGERLAKKKDKIHTVAKRGGAKVRYGLKLENGVLTRAELRGVPVFYLGLTSEELDELVGALRDDDAEVMEVIFKKLIDSLKLQQAELGAASTHAQFQKKLQTFGELLERVSPGGE